MVKIANTPVDTPQTTWAAYQTLILEEQHSINTELIAMQILPIRLYNKKINPHSEYFAIATCGKWLQQSGGAGSVYNDSE